MLQRGMSRFSGLGKRPDVKARLAQEELMRGTHSVVNDFWSWVDQNVMMRPLRPAHLPLSAHEKAFFLKLPKPASDASLG